MGIQDAEAPDQPSIKAAGDYILDGSAITQANLHIELIGVYMALTFFGAEGLQVLLGKPTYTEPIRQRGGSSRRHCNEKQISGMEPLILCGRK
jgi:hypothetical protein